MDQGMETARLEELPGGKTKLTVQSVFQSVADRDGMIQGGMEGGVSESHERPDELLERMRKKKISWEKFYYNDMTDLMEYLNQGMP